MYLIFRLEKCGYNTHYLYIKLFTTFSSESVLVSMNDLSVNQKELIIKLIEYADVRHWRSST